MKTTEKEWDEVRSAFAASIMVDTSLYSLAQNLDGPPWPVQAREDTPAKYIDLTFEEVVELIQFKGHALERLDELVAILRETLAFDTPYEDMVAQAEAAGQRDNPVLKNLAKLGIPENFPVALTSFGAEAREFCAAERLSTLGEFAVSSQNMSKNVIVGGDFRTLLNALSHVDEAALAGALPFRPGHKGLHLEEAVAQAAASADGPGRTQLAVGWFRADVAALEQDLAAGGSLERFFVRLGNPSLEKRAAELLRPHLRGAAPVEKKRSGWLSWFSRKK